MNRGVMGECTLFSVREEKPLNAREGGGGEEAEEPWDQSLGLIFTC